MVIRRLFRAPRVIVLVATIGVAQLSLADPGRLPEAAQPGAAVPRGRGPQLAHRQRAAHGPRAADPDRGCRSSPSALGWFLNRTMLGRTVQAAAEQPRSGPALRHQPTHALDAGVGRSPALVATVSMILIGGLGGDDVELHRPRAQHAGAGPRRRGHRPTHVVPHGPAGRLAIGVVEAIIEFNFLDQPGLIDVLLFLVALVAVWLPARGGGEGEAAFSFTPPVEPIPDRLQGPVLGPPPRPRRAARRAGRGAVVVPLIVTQPSRHLLYATILAFAICALSLTVLTGWAGQLSLGQMAFAGIGALTAAALTRGLNVDWVIGGVTLLQHRALRHPVRGRRSWSPRCSPPCCRSLIGVGALRVRGLLLAVTTFAFAIAAPAWIYGLDLFSGGNASSVAVPPRRPVRPRPAGPAHLLLRGAGRPGPGHGRCSAACGGPASAGSPIAVRDNADAAASYTVRPALTKLRAFALAGFIAGLGGALLAGPPRPISFSDSPFVVGLTRSSLVAIVVIGGMGSTGRRRDRCAVGGRSPDLVPQQLRSSRC